jgi:hypothetical protein
MNRSTIRPLIASTVVAACTLAASLSPMTASAQTLQSPTYSADQVRSTYVDHGFQTSQPITWWTNNTTTFTVEDPTELNSPSARVLMVIVYPDSRQAAAAQQNGTQLVQGYGPPTWQGNVALVQTTRGELARRYQAEVDQNDPTAMANIGSRQQLAEPTSPVSSDLVAVLTAPVEADL